MPNGKRSRMLKRNRTRRDAEYRITLSEVFSDAEIRSMCPEDVVSLGSALKREKAIERKRTETETRERNRAREIAQRKHDAEIAKFNAEIAERKREGICC